MGDGVHQADAPRVAAVFADLLEAAEFEMGAAPGLVPSQPGLLVLPSLRLEMRAQFLVQIRVDGAAIQQRARPKQEIAEHTPPYACWSTLATAAVIFRQALCPACSRLRPRAVSS